MSFYYFDNIAGFLVSAFEMIRIRDLKLSNQSEKKIQASF